MGLVLIAEDDVNSLENIRKALNRKGLDVVSTSNGIEAVQMVREKNPAVLLLDINLPGTSGIRVLDEIKRFSPATHVIMMTGSFDSETEKKAKNLGAYAFLKKPFMIEVLFKLLSDLKIIS